MTTRYQKYYDCEKSRIFCRLLTRKRHPYFGCLFVNCMAISDREVSIVHCTSGLVEPIGTKQKHLVKMGLQPISNNTHQSIYNVISHTCHPTFNAVEGRAWMSNHILRINLDVIIYPCPNPYGSHNLCYSKWSQAGSKKYLAIIDGEIDVKY